ncbi:MAG: sulfite exporter TauE/SafE family protein [Myxococcota bacterium]
MLPLLSAALLAGLMGAPHCVGMCGGFAAATARTPLDALSWQTGKLTTYAALGALAGTFSGHLPGPGWLPLAAAAFCLVLFAAQLSGLVRLPARPIPGLSRLAAATLRRDGWAGRFGFGLLTGLLPCGLVYAALGLALGAGSTLGGAAAMAAFGVGTMPALAFAAVGARAIMQQMPYGRQLMAGAVLILGLSALFIRLPVTLNAQGTVTDLPVCHSTPG